MRDEIKCDPANKPVFVYVQGVGHDPATVQAYADVYGWEIQWPKKNVQDWNDPVGNLLWAVVFLGWMAPAFMWAFPRKRWLAAVVVGVGSLLLGVVSQAAVTGIVQTGANTYTVTWTEHSGGDGWNAVYVSGPGDSAPYQNLVSGSSWTAGSGEFEITEEHPERYVHWSTSSQLTTYGPYHFGAAPTYKITFTIPANPGPSDVTYAAMQNGEQVGQYTQPAGASQALWQLTGLESDDDVSLVEFHTVTTWSEDPLNPGHYFPSSVEVTGVSTHGSGTPTTTGPTVPAPPPPSTPSATTVPSAPAPAAPTAPPVSAPTSSAPVVGPTPFSTPFGTTETSDTSGAKTQDVANAANATVEALNEIAQKATDNANGIITAINTAAASATTNANGIITAINTGNAATVGGLNGVISALNSLKAQLAAQEAKEGSATGVNAPQGLTDPSGQEAVWQPGELNVETMVSGKLPQAPAINTSVSSASTIAIEFEIPVPGGSAIQVSKVIDFGAPPFAAPIAIFRTMMNVFVTLGFYLLTFYTVRGAFTTAK